jgi:hypothetical protein
MKAQNGRIAAISMIGLKRLDAVMKSVKELANKGDLVEVGVWRGGSLAWMAALAKCYSPESLVIGFDTFEGFRDKDLLNGDRYKYCNYLRVSQEQVSRNIKALGLMLCWLRVIVGSDSNGIHLARYRYCVLMWTDLN